MSNFSFAMLSENFNKLGNKHKKKKDLRERVLKKKMAMVVNGLNARDTGTQDKFKGASLSTNKVP
jgi:hypothetical protein